MGFFKKIFRKVGRAAKRVGKGISRGVRTVGRIGRSYVRTRLGLAPAHQPAQISQSSFAPSSFSQPFFTPPITRVRKQAPTPPPPEPKNNMFKKYWWAFALGAAAIIGLVIYATKNKNNRKNKKNW